MSSPALVEIAAPEDFFPLEGVTIGPTRWKTIDQQRIDGFAECTDDRQWIHTDPRRAARGPYQGTVAHGYLTLALVSAWLYELIRLSPELVAINYGLNRVRFPAAVRAGSRLRMTAEVTECKTLPAGTRVVFRCMVTADGEEIPACVAEPVIVYLESADS